MNKTIATPDSARPHGRDAALRITAPGRLHLGFVDLAGTLGRRFGSLGVALERPSTIVRLSPAAALAARGPDSDRARATVEKVARRLGLSDHLDITVEAALPAHAGLGSGTQMALAAASGLCLLQGRTPDARLLGEVLGRGARSSIGIGAFTEGGVILDGGKRLGTGAGDAPPPILSRLPFPEEWRILLVYDHAHQGLSGAEENEAMANLPPFADTLAAHLARLVLMVALPALAEHDVRHFGEAIGEMQRLLGDHYAGAQGGRYTSSAVAEVMSWIEGEGIKGVGQSSWGPTGFAIVGSGDEADKLLHGIRDRFGDRPGLDFDSVRGSNRGARIEWLTRADHDGAPDG
ncbi:beta-ribofuranosylaminobenzene 5'-phosphate synthase family protein [Ancylobacter terrae]|uniref:beta-ribofuranosylaminobenzene 5'-phosphate synthase family protein n=1 Tax=Ancylobacter sp. sgz301288 TaxID=3342077 RepID=UPI00385BC922